MPFTDFGWDDFEASLLNPGKDTDAPPPPLLPTSGITPSRGQQTGVRPARESHFVRQNESSLQPLFIVGAILVAIVVIAR